MERLTTQASEEALPSPRKVRDPEDAQLASLSYRPEIDGIRAIAVLAVVIFHAGFGVPGGFIGVDVFFVLSGYLITALILRDIHRGSFSMVDFWERRVRRIAPALSVVVLASTLAGGVVLLSLDLERFGRSLLAQTAFVSNVYFWLNGGYFDGASKEKPLLHTWSLAVEEQFYVFLPITMLLGYRFLKWRGRKLLAALFALFLGSLLLSMWAMRFGGVIHRQVLSGVYYLLPFRAWEMIAGSLVAALPLCWFPRRQWVRETASAAGLLLILGCAFLYTSKTPFPGVAAVPPCLGAALLIWANTQTVASEPSRLTVCGRWLAASPLVFIGLISYSLYLWHWPLLAYARYLSADTMEIRLGLVLLSLVAAVISWKWVETPVRKRHVLATRRSLFRFLGFSAIAFLFMGNSVLWLKGMPWRFSGIKAANDELVSRDDLLREFRKRERTREVAADYRRNATVEGIAPKDVYPIGKRAHDTPATFLLWGDSHAYPLTGVVDTFLKKAGVAGHAIIIQGQAPLAGYASEPGKDGEAAAQAVLAHLEKHPEIRRLLLVGFWSTYQLKNKESLKQALRQTLTFIQRKGIRLWVLKDVPAWHEDIPRTLARVGADAFYQLPEKPSVSNYLARNSVVPEVVGQFPEVTLIDGSLPFRIEGQDHFRVEENGVSFYMDSNHLTNEAAEKMLRPMLEEALLPELLPNR